MAVKRQNEVLDKAISTDNSVIPRYDLVTPSGTKVAENVQLVLKNEVLQQGTPYNKKVLDELLAASGVTTGSENAYELAQEGYILEDGATVRFKLHIASGAGPTLNVNGTGAKPLMSTATKYMKVGTDAGMWITAIYNATMGAYIVQGNGFIPTEAGQAHQLIFTESTIFDPAQYGLTVGDQIKVTCVGGGGGGGSSTAKRSKSAVGASGGNGATSSFGSYVSAAGGSGGGPSGTDNGGIGMYNGGAGSSWYTTSGSYSGWAAGGGGAGGFIPNVPVWGGNGSSGIRASEIYTQASVGSPGWGGSSRGATLNIPTGDSNYSSTGESGIIVSYTPTTSGDTYSAGGCKGNPGLFYGGGSGTHTIRVETSFGTIRLPCGGGGSGYGAGGGGASSMFAWTSDTYGVAGAGGGGSGYVVTQYVTLDNPNVIPVTVGGGGSGAAGGIAAGSSGTIVPSVQGNNGTSSGGGAAASNQSGTSIGGAGGYGNTLAQSPACYTATRYSGVGGGGGAGGCVIIEW